MGMVRESDNCSYTAQYEDRVEFNYRLINRLSTVTIYPFSFTACNTQLRLEDGKFIYENRISRKPVKVNGVYRDYGIMINGQY